MLIREYRVVLPITVEQYQVGQLYAVAQASMNETGGGEGVEVVRNEPFENVPLLGGRYTKGQYTYKIYHLKSRLPAFLKLIAPTGSTEIHEEAWNAYPYCRTVLKNPGYMKDKFFISIETIHLPDRGTTDNAHFLSQDKLINRKVMYIDIANDPVAPADYKDSEDPAKFRSQKAGVGPLKGKWRQEVDPVMTCYKLVTCEFKWFGLQNRVENFIQNTERRLFLKFHRQVFCWLDNWYGLTMQQIRELEEATKRELEEQRKSGDRKGSELTE